MPPGHGIPSSIEEGSLGLVMFRMRFGDTRFD
jgi:hypothetical protein